MYSDNPLTINFTKSSRFTRMNKSFGDRIRPDVSLIAFQQLITSQKFPMLITPPCVRM